MSAVKPLKERNVSVKQHRVYYIACRRVEGVTIAEIAKELGVSPRTITRDLNSEHYTLLCNELIQQQITTLKQLSPQEAWKSRQKLIELMWPQTQQTTTTTTTTTAANNNTKHKKQQPIDPNSQEYKTYYTHLQKRVDKHVLDPNSQEYKDYHNLLKERIDKRVINEPNTQESEDFHNLLKKQMDVLFAFSERTLINKVPHTQPIDNSHLTETVLPK
ncbi:MAG: ECF-type sigma factor [Candidatus Bathyarchaeota archaeon]|nr:ECF-type sigma factor [Candidatus Termiticorpusculum sp.]